MHILIQLPVQLWRYCVRPQLLLSTEQTVVYPPVLSAVVNEVRRSEVRNLLFTVIIIRCVVDEQEAGQLFCHCDILVSAVSSGNVEIVYVSLT